MVDRSGVRPAPSPTRPAWRQRWARHVERRRAERDLDAALGVRRYPDVGVAYELRSSEEAS